MTNTKVVLLIGRSGRGKSTLANIVTNTNDFKESSASVSETKKIQVGDFKENDIDYQIIDTPGIGDTKMSDDEVLDIIAEAVYLARDGISQVFFVIDGRFDRYEMATYDLLRTIIFDENITKHTTIIRTRFDEFKKKEKCQADIDKMVKEAQEKKAKLKDKITDKEKKNTFYLWIFNNNQYKELSKEIEQLKKELANTNLAGIIKSCQGKIVYVDNPSLRILPSDDEDNEGEKSRRAKIKSNGRKRAESRKILLEHLSKNCQKTPYKPEKLAQLSEAIAEDYFQYLKKKEELQKELDSLKSKEGKPVVSESKIFVSESSKAESVAEKKQIQVEAEDTTKETKEMIAKLQDRKEELLKEIAEKEKIIHQKVLKHIFNNYEAINKELGGDIFLSSVAGDHNWPEINEKFANQELVVKWLSQGFNYEQTKEWATVLGKDFNPQTDADFCVWLRDVKKLTVEKIKGSNFNIEQLRKEYFDYLKRETKTLGRFESWCETFGWCSKKPDKEEKKASKWTKISSTDKFCPSSRFSFPLPDPSPIFPILSSNLSPSPRSSSPRSPSPSPSPRSSIPRSPNPRSLNSNPSPSPSPRSSSPNPNPRSPSPSPNPSSSPRSPSPSPNPRSSSPNPSSSPRIPSPSPNPSPTC